MYPPVPIVPTPLSVCPVDSSRLSIDICRRRQSAAARGQRQCCDPTRIDADVLVQSRVGARNHVLHGGAHWRHLANTTAQSVRSSDAALCQITLTTCCFIFRLSSKFVINSLLI